MFRKATFILTNGYRRRAALNRPKIGDKPAAVVNLPPTIAFDSGGD
jgi:hypothetical protein